MFVVAIVVEGFATRNIFNYMFAGSLACLYWMLVATAFSVPDATVGVRA
jgi:hypothetical protein